MGQGPAALVVLEGCRCFPKLHQLLHPLYFLSSRLITGPTILDFVRNVVQKKEPELRHKQAWAGIPALPCIRCVTLG